MSDPPMFVGEPYDSAYLGHSQLFEFETPPSTEVIVDLEWDLSTGAPLAMWALDGTIESEPRDRFQTLRLPAGTRGILIIGLPRQAGEPKLPVAFRLETQSRTAPQGGPGFGS